MNWKQDASLIGFLISQYDKDTNLLLGKLHDIYPKIKEDTVVPRRYLGYVENPDWYLYMYKSLKRGDVWLQDTWGIQRDVNNHEMIRALRIHWDLIMFKITMELASMKSMIHEYQERFSLMKEAGWQMGKILNTDTTTDAGFLGKDWKPLEDME